jgi:hypothetical protein
MVTFSGAVTLPNGTVVPASGTAIVRPRMLVGVDTPGTAAALTSHKSLFPGLTGPTRLFSKEGAGLPPWTGVLASVPATWIPHPSFKDMPTKTAFLAWLSAAPSTWRQIWVTYHHEPEGDLDAATYRANWQLLWQWAAGHPRRSLFKLVPIHTLYWSRHKGDWHQWWPGVGDYMGWDCYDEQARYEDPASFFALPFSAAAEAGVPLIVSELGAILPLKADGTRDTSRSPARAAWITACVAYLRRNGCRSVAWWCAPGTSATLYYPLEEFPPETAAYKAEAAR